MISFSSQEMPKWNGGLQKSYRPRLYHGDERDKWNHTLPFVEGQTCNHRFYFYFYILKHEKWFHPPKCSMY